MSCGTRFARPLIHLTDVAGDRPIVESVDVVERVRQRDAGPAAVVETWIGGSCRIGLDELPVGFKFSRPAACAAPPMAARTSKEQVRHNPNACFAVTIAL